MEGGKVIEIAKVFTIRTLSSKRHAFLSLSRSNISKFIANIRRNNQ